MATIRDVAKMSGVSTATVSNVLNARNDRVSLETREKVLAAVRALKYRPTALEQNQKAILTQNVGVMVPDLTQSPLLRHAYFTAILDGVVEVAAFRGWSVTIFVHNMWDDVGHAIRRSYDGRCDGLIVIAPQPGHEVVQTLHERGTPLMLVGTTPWLPHVSSVDIDNVATGRIVAEHMLALGHRRFAYAAELKEHVSSQERARGFQSAVCEAGGEYVRLTAKEGPEIKELAERIVAMGDDRPTAFFGWHDTFALRLMEALQAHGLRAPEDFSVAGVNDTVDGREAKPALTTVNNPLGLIGRHAATRFLDRLTSGTATDTEEIVRFAPELIVRASTGPAPIALVTRSRRISQLALGTNGGSFQ